MMRYCLAFIIWCFALALPATAHSPVARPSSDLLSGDASAHALGCGNYAYQESPEWDSNDRWRMRAARHLDCVVSIADRALSRTSAGVQSAESSEELRLSREDLEHIRTWAYWAKDAAMRIGR